MNGQAGIRIMLSGLSAHYGDGREVLHGLHFDDLVTTLAVIGRSGCGKTTLLRVLAGLLTPTQGSVSVGGRTLPFDEKELIGYRRSIGLVFQQGGLFAHLSARENIARPLQIVHGLSRGESLQRTEELLARFGLSAHGDKLPRELSGGQYQRIAIARAVAPRAELLLLDEPTSALDPQYTGEVLEMLEELRRAGTRFIIVTHELGFAARACDRLLFMEEGAIRAYGSSAELFRSPPTAPLRDFIADALHWLPPGGENQTKPTGI